MRALVHVCVALFAAHMAASQLLAVTDLFTDGMVLPSDQPRVHGFADPGAKVSLTVNGTLEATAIADSVTGMFILEIPARLKSQDNHTLAISTSRGAQATASGVLFGTVILCGG